MLAIKSTILKKWDISVTGVRVCCIKFVERVVTVQTPGVIADPRVRKPLCSSPCPGELLITHTATGEKRNIASTRTSRSSLDPTT
jgi:hypothetical protein